MMMRLPELAPVDLVLLLPMPKLLALDQSSKVTGVAIFEDGKLCKYSKIDVDGELPYRLTEIRNRVKNIITEEGITEVAIEDIQLQSNVVNNVETYRTLAEVRGVLEELFQELKIPCSIVLAGTWKSKLGIRGARRADQKRAAQEYIVNKYGIKPIQDICDAICIGDYITNNTLPTIQTDGFDWAD